MSESRDRPGVPERLGGDAASAPLPALDDGDASRVEVEASAATASDVGPAASVAGDDVPEGRSPRSATCPYLRLADVDGALGRPLDVVAEGHCCIAMGEAAPLSDRQQSLVCLTTSHQDCPRYLRAILVIPVAEPVVAPRRRVHPATLVATVLLGLSAVLAVAFTAARGGIAMPIASTTPAPSQVAAASATPSLSPVVSPSPVASPTATRTLAPSPTPRPTATPTTSPTPTPSPTPAPTVTPRPTSDRYEVLVPCPDKPDCWIYTVRAGDNLFSIANWFGVPLETVYELNPWTRTSGLRTGQELILPPPTR